MTLAINTVDGRGLSKKARRDLLPKKTKVLAIHFKVKDVLPALQY